MNLGGPHRHYLQCDSTNAQAKALAATGAPHGTVLTADEQTAGRGRQGRDWIAPPGRALLYSLLLRRLGDRPLLPLAAALAVCETVEEMAPKVQCEVKWPNDIQVEGRKLAGILIEARPQDDWAVIGVGLNLTIAPDEFPPDLRDRATSLATATSHEFGATQTAGNTRLLRCTALLSAALERWIDADDAAILPAWGERDALEGQEISWENGSGVARGVDGRGSLLVDTSGGAIALAAGEVHLL